MYFPSWQLCANWLLSKNKFVYFDLFGCFFWFLKRELFLGRRVALLEWLIQFFKFGGLNNQMWVVFDGARSSEKSDVGRIRLAKLRGDIEKYFSMIQVEKERRAAGGRTTRNRWKWLEKAGLEAYHPSNEDIEFLKEGNN